MSTYTGKRSSRHTWRESQARQSLRNDGLPLDGSVQIPGHGRHSGYGRHGGEICYRFDAPDIPRIAGNHEQENPAK